MKSSMRDWVKDDCIFITVFISSSLLCLIRLVI
jgi:hypothetical protein